MKMFQFAASFSVSHLIFSLFVPAHHWTWKSSRKPDLSPWLSACLPASFLCFIFTAWRGVFEPRLLQLTYIWPTENTHWWGGRAASFCQFQRTHTPSVLPRWIMQSAALLGSLEVRGGAIRCCHRKSTSLQFCCFTDRKESFIVILVLSEFQELSILETGSNVVV